MSAVGRVCRTTPRPLVVGCWLAVVLGAAVGCGPFGEDSAPPDDPDAWLDSPLIRDWSIEISPKVPTVARVTWTSEQPASGSVRFGEPGVLGSSTPVTPESTEHQLTLLGLLPDTDYAFQLSVDGGGESVESSELGFRTGNFPEPPPSLSLASHDPSASAGGFTVMPIQGETTCWTTVLDSMARVVWAQSLDCYSHRASLAPDGSGIVSQSREKSTEDMVIRHVSFFGEHLDEVHVPDAHHDITIIGDGSYATLGYSLRNFDRDGEELRVVGDTILEVDSEGEIRVVWDLFDHLEPDLDALNTSSDWAADSWDWAHCNYLQYVPAEDAFYVTSRALNAVFKVDRATGDLLWTLSDTRGDFVTPPGDALVHTPHSVEPVDGGLLLFNQRSGDMSPCSEAVVVDLDIEAGTAARGWSYQTSDCLSVDYLGSAWPLPNGNALVVFSQSGQLDEVTPGGDVVSRANTELGWTLSYAEHAPSLYIGARP